MPGIQIQFQGVEKLRAKLAALPSHAQAAFDVALVKEAQGILADAQEKAPVKTGRLKSGGEVTAKREGFKAVVTLAYGAPYAVYVHAKEYWANGRVYKPSRWLSKAADRAAKTMAGRLIRAVRATLKGTVYAR